MGSYGMDCVGLQLHFVALPAADIGVRARVLRGASCSPSDSGKTIIFRENAKFFPQKPAAKTEEKDLLFVKTDQYQPVYSHFSRLMSCPLGQGAYQYS